MQNDNAKWAKTNITDIEGEESEPKEEEGVPEGQEEKDDEYGGHN